MTPYPWILDIRVERRRHGTLVGGAKTQRYQNISTRSAAENMAAARLAEEGGQEGLRPDDVDKLCWVIPFASREWAHGVPSYLDQQDGISTLDLGEADPCDDLARGRTNQQRPQLGVSVRIFEDIPRWRIATGMTIVCAAPVVSQAIAFCDDFRRFRASYARLSPSGNRLLSHLIGVGVADVWREIGQLHKLLIDRPDIETPGQLRAVLAGPEMSSADKEITLRMTAVAHWI